MRPAIWTSASALGVEKVVMVVEAAEGKTETLTLLLPALMHRMTLDMLA